LSAWLKPYLLTEEECSLRQAATKRYTPLKKDHGEVSKLFQAVPGRELSRLQKGKLAEAAVALRLVVHGFEVYVSTFDGDKPDWVVRVLETGKAHTIQLR